MEVYLMQHGPALPKEQDPEEGLGPEGQERIHTSGQALRKMGVNFDAILCSPKKRSQQTAAIVAEEAIEYLQAPIVRVAAPMISVPAGKNLDGVYVPDQMAIKAAVQRVM